MFIKQNLLILVKFLMILPRSIRSFACIGVASPPLVMRQPVEGEQLKCRENGSNEPMLATATKILKFQMPISQKLVRVFKRTGCMFYLTKKSICTINFIFICRIHDVFI